MLYLFKIFEKNTLLFILEISKFFCYFSVKLGYSDENYNGDAKLVLPVNYSFYLPLLTSLLPDRTQRLSQKPMLAKFGERSF
jgi:hypothetical protein